MELVEKKEIDGKEKSLAEAKADELRKKLEFYEKTGIGYPFDFSVVETLYEFCHEPAIEDLIGEKQNALRIILEGMELEYGIQRAELKSDLIFGENLPLFRRFTMILVKAFTASNTILPRERDLEIGKKF